MSDQLFDINYWQLGKDTLPNEARTTEVLAASNGLLSAFNRMHQRFLGTKRGADWWTGVSVWYASTWSFGDMTIYFPTGEVYECMVATTTAEPSTSTDWLKIQDSFIGTDELVKFNGLKLNLEYALNRRFITNYIDPPGVSDIYISTIGAGISSFIIGGAPSNSSKVFLNSSSEYVINAFLYGTAFDFKIYIPISLSVTLGAQYEKAIRTFVDKYITYGLKYLIQTY